MHVLAAPTWLHQLLAVVAAGGIISTTQMPSSLWWTV
jgi:hypothetical protein